MKYVQDKSSFYSLNMIDETLYTFIKVMIDIAFREFRFVHFSKLDKHSNSHTILLIEQMLKIWFTILSSPQFLTYCAFRF